MALLISSVGLAASLLVGAAIDHAGAPSLSWQPTVRLAQPTSELSLRQQVGAQALPESLRSLVPAYSFASGTAASVPLVSPAGDQLTEQFTSATPASLSAASSLRMTIQRSWITFKLAFR